VQPSPHHEQGLGRKRSTLLIERVTKLGSVSGPGFHGPENVV